MNNLRPLTSTGASVKLMIGFLFIFTGEGDLFTILMPEPMLCLTGALEDGGEDETLVFGNILPAFEGKF